MDLPIEIYESITDYVETSEKKPSTFEIRTEMSVLEDYGEPLKPDSIQRLSVLRLVNKTFRHCASRRLFRHVTASGTPEMFSSSLTRLDEISRSSCAQYIFSVAIQLHGAETRSKEYLEFAKPSSRLGICLRRLPNVRSLNYLVESGFTWELHPDYLSNASILTNAVVDALLNGDVPKIEKLRIELPVTYMFKPFFELEDQDRYAEMKRIIENLDHLSLGLRDFTGESEYQSPTSLLKGAFPNSSHAFFFFEFVELGTKLQSLSICMEDSLNIDSLEFPRLVRLRKLSLESVSISDHKLLCLIQQCKDFICHVNLDAVELNSGKWQDVLFQMARLPHLVMLDMQDGGYSKTGTSAELRQEGVSFFSRSATWDPGPFCCGIESKNTFDHHALGNLQRQVNINRSLKGIPEIPDWMYRHLKLKPVEEMVD